MSVGVLFACLLVHYVYDWCQVAGNRVTDDCELVFRCWELNLGSLEEHPVLSTTEPSLQLHRSMVLSALSLYYSTKLD